MYKNTSAPSNNTTLWYYLSTKHLDFRCENSSTPGVIKSLCYPTCALNTMWILSLSMMNVLLVWSSRIEHLLVWRIYIVWKGFTNWVSSYKWKHPPIQKASSVKPSTLIKVRTVAQSEQSRLALCLEAQLYNCVFVAISLTVGSLALLPIKLQFNCHQLLQ